MMDRLTELTVFTELPNWGQLLAGLGVLVLAATVANIVVKHVILRLIRRSLTQLGHTNSSSYLGQVAQRLANIVPAIIISRGILLVPHISVDGVTIVQNVAHASIVLSIVLAISKTLDLLNDWYQGRPHAANRPIKGYIQVTKIILYGASVILIAAVLMEKSPLLLLSGLGAMAAVLMLVFKDTILSLVASVQLTSNDMLRVGDWIEAPQLNANGDVIDLALHTVKVQNFDKTITTIPTYRLISDPFRNWRGMSESGGRRIMRSLFIDQNSVLFLTEEQKDHLGRFAQLNNYIQNKETEISQWNKELEERGADPVNHRELTNIGTFRAYIQAYIASHPGIHPDMTQMVRQLAPTPEGLPIEIYCFTNTVKWVEYEAVQADIFDHLLAILPHFNLRLYQRPGGMDFRGPSQTEDMNKNNAMPQIT